jgi:hypothetical protein
LFTATSGAYLALFDGTTLLQATATYLSSSLTTLTLEYTWVPGSLTPIVLNPYVGTGSAGSAKLNGNASNRVLGGKMSTVMTVEEYNA